MTRNRRTTATVALSVGLTSLNVYAGDDHFTEQDVALTYTQAVVVAWAGDPAWSGETSTTTDPASMTGEVKLPAIKSPPPAVSEVRPPVTKPTAQTLEPIRENGATQTQNEPKAAVQAVSLVPELKSNSSRNDRGQTADKLSLPDALSLIYNNHPGVVAARNRFGAASMQFDAAQYGAFPNLEIDSGKISGGSNVSTIRLTQPLYAFGRIENTTNAAEKRVDSARDGVMEQVRNLQEQTIFLYFDVLRTADRVRTATDNTAAHEQLYRMVERRLGSGVGSESDVELASTRLSQARSDEAAAKAAWRKNRTNLGTLLSVTINTLEMPALTESRFRTDEQLLDLAIGNSPLLRRLTNEAEALKFEALALKAATRPQFVLRAERIENNANLQFSDTRMIAALQFNPGSGLSASANADAGAARAEAAEQDIARASLELSDKTLGLRRDYEQTQDQLTFLESLKASNAKLVEAFLRQFQSGKRSWLDVLNAQREATQASLSYIDSLYLAQSLSHRMELIATGAESIGGTAEIKDLPTKPRLLETLLPFIASEKR